MSWSMGLSSVNSAFVFMALHRLKLPFTGLNNWLSQHHIRIVIEKTNALLLMGIEFRATAPRDIHTGHMQHSLFGTFQYIHIVVEYLKWI